MTQQNAKIIALVGLAGSGKSSAVDYFTQKGIPKIYFGGIIYQAMSEAGIEPTWDNQRVFREEIRAREGKDFVVKRVITGIHNLIQAGQKKIVLDGLYTWSEYKILGALLNRRQTSICIPIWSIRYGVKAALSASTRPTAMSWPLPGS